MCRKKIPLCTVIYVCPGLNKRPKKYYGIESYATTIKYPGNFILNPPPNLMQCALLTPFRKWFDWLVLLRMAPIGCLLCFHETMHCKLDKTPLSGHNIIFSPKEMMNFIRHWMKACGLSNCFGRGHRQLNQQEDQRCAVCVVLRWNLWPGRFPDHGSRSC